MKVPPRKHAGETEVIESVRESSETPLENQAARGRWGDSRRVTASAHGMFFVTYHCMTSVSWRTPRGNRQRQAGGGPVDPGRIYNGG
jgi:hypothetical protein